MRIIKHGHACVTLATGSSTVVLDPGMFTDRSALEGAGFRLRGLTRGW